MLWLPYGWIATCFWLCRFCLGILAGDGVDVLASALLTAIYERVDCCMLLLCECCMCFAWECMVVMVNEFDGLTSGC